MLDAWFGKPVVGDRRYTAPSHVVLLTASPQRSPPVIDDMVPERRQRPAVRWDRVVSEVARHDLPQPSSLIGNRLVPASLQLLLYLPELPPHAVAPGLPSEQECARA